MIGEQMCGQDEAEGQDADRRRRDVRRKKKREADEQRPKHRRIAFIFGSQAYYETASEGHINAFAFTFTIVCLHTFAVSQSGTGPGRKLLF